MHRNDPHNTDIIECDGCSQHFHCDDLAQEGDYNHPGNLCEECLAAWLIEQADKIIRRKK